MEVDRNILYYRIYLERLGVSGDVWTHAHGGEGGIRTPDTVARMPDFESGAFNHSATSPKWSS